MYLKLYGKKIAIDTEPKEMMLLLGLFKKSNLIEPSLTFSNDSVK